MTRAQGQPNHAEKKKNQGSLTHSVFGSSNRTAFLSMGSGNWKENVNARGVNGSPFHHQNKRSWEGEKKNGENESKGTKTTGEKKKKRNSERRKTFIEEEGEEKTLG